MGRTARTFRDAIRVEESRWKDFRRALRPVDRGLLDWIFDAARKHGDAGTVVLNPRTIEIVLLTAVVELAKEVQTLKKELNLDSSMTEACIL